MQRYGDAATRPKMLSTLRSLVNTILGKTGKPDRLDTATRMAMNVDFSKSREIPTLDREPAKKIDPIDELMRIIGEQQLDAPPPRQPKGTLRTNRRHSKSRR
jgi:hypothetical protein